MIRLARPSDLAAAAQLYADLFAHEAVHGTSTNWQPGIYPTPATAQRALAAGTLFVFEEHGEILASMILNHLQPPEYAEQPWRIAAEGDRVLVIHTLCVRPSASGRGIGRRMIAFARRHARALDCAVIRIDTWAGNHRAATLYASEGFRYVGKARVLHEGAIDEELIFLETDPSLAPLEFDPSPSAVIDPGASQDRIPGCPGTVVTCFAHNLIDYALARFGGEEIGSIEFANRPLPLYRTEIDGVPVGLTLSFQGAPNAVSQYESLFAMGAERIVTFGTCGVLRRDIADCAIILPDGAVRDEGTSRHYAPPSAEIPANVHTLSRLQRFFTAHHLGHTTGKVWTTDGFFRETPAKIATMRARGCLAVEMECAAVAALAQFRGKQIAHFLYAADNLDAEIWDERSLSNAAGLDSKQILMNLALQLGAEWERESK